MGLIDCDIHNVVPNVEALFPHLSAYWVDHVHGSVFKGPIETYYPKNAPATARPDSKPVTGPAGSNLELLQSQALDPLGVEVAILACLYAVDTLKNPEAASAFAQAVNDWQIAQWLEKDARLRASIVVPAQIPALAIQEIERIGDHPGFVQVILPARSHHPYGNRLYHPLWEAIAKRGLVAALHFGGAPGNPAFPSGWPSHHYEEYAGMAQNFQAQLTSIIAEGVFDLCPTLRLVCLEAGFSWVPAFMWRFDKEWRNLRMLTPWVRRAPSAYLRDHVRFTIQPLDLPPDTTSLLNVVDQLGSEDLLLFGSDYPHGHAHDPFKDFLDHLSPELAQKIRSSNARQWYGFA